MRVLLVEDDDSIADPLVSGLRREGFEVERVATGAEALAAPVPDVVLLDLGLPDLDGYEVCRRLRARSGVPIVVVTARSDEVDRVVGLELGADDYVVKPFGFRELVARIRAVTRRAAAATPAEPAGNPGAPAGNPGVPAGTPGAPEPVRVGDLVVDLRAHRVTVGGQEVALTPKEFDLLLFLARDPGAVRTREQILDEVWEPHWFGPTKTLDVHVASLRRKLGDPGRIETVRGIGFRLRAPA